MFGLFKSAPVSDSQLGELRRAGGLWRGSITIGASAAVPLAIAGGRREPDTQAVQIARQVATRFAGWRPIIEQALFEHYQPHGESLPDDHAAARLAAASDVWPQVVLIYVAVTPLDDTLGTELGYTTTWDDEHTLGARFRGEQFIELCGSVLPP